MNSYEPTPNDSFAQAMGAKHTYGPPESIPTYRDRDGANFFSSPGPSTMEIRVTTRRRVATTYPDGIVVVWWETMSEAAAGL